MLSRNIFIWMKDNINIFQTYIDVLTLNYRKTVIIRFEGVMCQTLLALLIFAVCFMRLFHQKKCTSGHKIHKQLLSDKHVSAPQTFYNSIYFNGRIPFLHLGNRQWLKNHINMCEDLTLEDSH